MSMFAIALAHVPSTGLDGVEHCGLLARPRVERTPRKVARHVLAERRRQVPKTVRGRRRVCVCARARACHDHKKGPIGKGGGDGAYPGTRYFFPAE